MKRALLWGVLSFFIVPMPAAALYVQNGTTLWPRGSHIEVCWSGVDPTDSTARRVQQMVDEQWGRYSSLSFVGWGDCGTDSRISLGRDKIMIKKIGGLQASHTDGLGQQQAAAALLELNFDSELLASQVPPVTDVLADILGIWCGNSPEECVGAIAVHEFGHLLGFAHEHDRPDRPFEVCTYPITRLPVTGDDTPGTFLTTYDSSSVMNYCRRLFTNELTAKDIAGLQRTYGRKPEGALLTRTGLCATGLPPVVSSQLGRVSLERCLNPESEEEGERKRALEQQWSLEVSKGNRLRSRADDNFCLDTMSEGLSRGTPVGLAPCHPRSTLWYGSPIMLKSLGGAHLVPFGDRVVSTVPSFPTISRTLDTIIHLPETVAHEAADFFSGIAGFGGVVDVTPPGWVINRFGQIINSQTDKCLDADTGTKGDPVKLLACDPFKQSQRFFLKPTGHIKTSFPGICLELNDGNGQPNPVGGLPLILWSCQSAAVQQDTDLPLRYSTRVMDQLFWISGYNKVPASMANCLERRNAPPQLFIGACDDFLNAFTQRNIWDHYAADPMAAPVVTLSSSTITVEATGPSGAVATFDASATEVVDGALPVTTSRASGSMFPIGDTTVTATASDATGSTTTATLVVTVVDTTAPVVTVPSSPLVVEATSAAGAVVTFTLSAQDIVDGMVAVTPTHASGSVFPLGPTTVTATAKDKHGNSASKDFVVEVVDTTKPLLKLPDNITVSMCANPSVGTATATDAVSTPVVKRVSPNPFVLVLGPNNVTWTATDAAGNVATGVQIVTAVLGDDASCCPSGTKVIVGTSGSEVLVGTDGRDCILTRGGDDVIDARGGDDFISSGSGNDNVVGGFGNDLINGGDGNDTIDAGPGNDRVNGGAGTDTIMAGTGSDTVDGGTGTDNCSVPTDGTDSVKGCP